MLPEEVEFDDEDLEHSYSVYGPDCHILDEWGGQDEDYYTDLIKDEYEEYP